MKKIIVMLIVGIVSAGVMNAQDESKPEKVYIPEQGEFAIGFDASPLVRYVGNLFNGSAGNGFTGLSGTPFTYGYDYFRSDIMPDVSIMAKYMLTDEFALKANVGLLVRSSSDRSFIKDDAALLENPLSEAKVTDIQRTNRTGVSLMLGGEYRLGKKRIQGVFGAGVLFAMQNISEKYTYGNALTAVNQSPSTAISGTGGVSIPSGYRLLKHANSDANFYTGLTASAGIEWFVAPKISIGAEVNISAYYLFGAEEYAVSEGYNSALAEVETRTDLISPGDSQFVFGTESLGGSLYMTFWF